VGLVFCLHVQVKWLDACPTFIQKSDAMRCNNAQLMTELMGLPEWQCELDLCIRYEFNVVHLNF
jgi:hypothetical protein